MSKKLNINNPATKYITETKEKQKNNEGLDMEQLREQVKKEIIEEMGLKIERKSKRAQFLLKPSLFNKLKEDAEKNGTTANNLINTILETYFKS